MTNADTPPPIPLPGPLSLGELLDRAFRLYRLRFRSFLTLAALFLVPYAVVSGLATGSFMVGYVALLQNVSAPDEFLSGGSALGFVGATLLLALAGVVVLLLVSTTLTSHAVAALRGESPSVHESLRGGLRRFWAAVGMNILKGLAFLALGAALVVAFAGVGALYSLLAAVGAFALGGEGATGTVVAVGLVVGFFCFTLIGGMALAAPVLYLAGRWLVALPGIVDQEWGPRAALRGAWRLSAGQVWRVVGYVVLLWVLSVVITSGPLYLVQWIVLFGVGGEGGMLAVTSLSSAFGTLLSIVWQPLYAIAVTLLYFDLRVRREGLDIAARLALLEAEVLPATETPAAV